jgi:glycosyltransferase involved in cell wall biosynthesis
MKTSIIIPTRNDNFGGNLVETATACIQTMSKSFDEVIIVDFGSKEPLCNFMAETDNNNVKFIIVPESWVISKVGDTTTMADVFARNIGIRRATNDMIISSNIDIIPGPRVHFDLLDFEKNKFYTSPKYMIDRSIAVPPWDQLQEYLYNNRESYYRQPAFNGDPWSIVSGCGDFQMGHRSIWFDSEVRGFEETMIYKDYLDTNLQKKIIVNAHKEVLPILNIHVFHQSHEHNRGKVKSNDPSRSVWNFGKTTNTENWGVPDEEFEERLI